jgi:lipopolysaccharide transport system ATP-binding protein
MNKLAIKIDNLGKKYQLGESQPYYSIRETISEIVTGKSKRDKVSEIWALKNINLEINRGESLGIIGRNGAGKSTLLKILSRITGPTIGEITLYGRVASLLEVGTGFHPELSGRENIYLNGSIMGMKRKEIQAKFDEIVSFSEIEKFLDTPVKRYSSGMYVRLAFAVAAHLESEILLVDEVLAVGDAEFQKKCLGKMSDVSGKGRTVIFVSHNMGAVSRLCNKTILLEEGTNIDYGETDKVIDKYLRGKKDLIKSKRNLKDAPRWPGYKQKIITSISILNPAGEPTSIVKTGNTMIFRFGYDVGKKIEAFFHIVILNELGERVLVLHTKHTGITLNLEKTGEIECVIEDLRLLSGEYTVMIETGLARQNIWLDNVPEAIKFMVKLDGYLGDTDMTNGRLFGYVAQKNVWRVF